MNKHIVQCLLVIEFVTARRHVHQQKLLQYHETVWDNYDKNFDLIRLKLKLSYTDYILTQTKQIDHNVTLNQQLSESN